MRAALEILDQSTARKTRHNTRGERRAGRGQGEGGEKRQNKDRTETNRGSEGAGAKDTERRGRTTHQSAQEDKKKRGQERAELKWSRLKQRSANDKGGMSKVRGHTSVM